jgi:hypothetical protein
VNGNGTHGVKHNKPDSERQVADVFSHMWNLKNRKTLENRRRACKEWGESVDKSGDKYDQNTFI